MTQDELAKKMGYTSRASINKIEMGRPVTQKIIVRLADALDVTPAYLMGWLDEEESAPSEKDALIAEIAAIFSRLSPEKTRQVLQYAQFLLSQQEEP